MHRSRCAPLDRARATAAARARCAGPTRGRSPSGQRWGRARLLGAALGYGGSSMGLSLLVSCAAQSAPSFPTAPSLPTAERRPDAIAVDFLTESPRARDRGEVSDAVVTLRTPLGIDAAYTTVRRFFRAVVQEDTAALGLLLIPQAVTQDLGTLGPSKPNQPARAREAVNFWSQRFRQHEYQQLAAHVIYREPDIETYRVAQLQALPAFLRQGLGPSSSTMAETDLVLRVPIVTSGIRSERLLGTELYFWLRRVDDRYLITYLAEPFPF
jgi:hypothetical protein